MMIKFMILAALVYGAACSYIGQEVTETKPIELDVIKAMVGVWDAEVEVWPEGLDSPSMKFKGVETNSLYGEHWISSDSDFGGMKIHAIVGYDLDKKKMVGTVIDDGPYAASMEGDYDTDSKSVTWTTKFKDANGKPMVQKTVVTDKSADERLLVLSVPGKEPDEFIKFMQIKFLKRK
jgi:Protein of unknown function (DUF1579)